MSRHRKRERVDRDAKFTVTIESLSHDGRGIARVDGKTTFVFNALPGEEVVIQYRARHKQYDEAQACEILKASQDRVKPICDVFGICGGCSLQHLSPKMQIAYKQNVFAEQLQQYAAALPEKWLEPITADTEFYRRKARLSVREVLKKETVMLGFRERDGRFVVDMNSCPLLVRKVGDHFAALRELLLLLPEKAHIPQIEVSVGDDAAIIIRHLQPLSDETINKLTDFCKDRCLWLYLQPGNESTIHKVYPQDNKFLLSYVLPEYNIKFNFSPSGFIQVNEKINEKMIARVIELLHLTGKENILDLFCGIGNISLPLAKFANKVVGVEASEVAVKEAINNAVVNNISNAEFYTANLFADCANDSWAQQQYDVLILDPPRAGAKEILELLPKFAAQKIVYVSCHPMTLARDAAIILEHGYKFYAAGVMDMFPHTQHVESIAFFYK